jgi:hypothetical protein
MRYDRDKVDFAGIHEPWRAPILVVLTRAAASEGKFNTGFEVGTKYPHGPMS